MKNKNYSAVYRIIHWSIAISMVLLLITILLRLTWMNKNNVAEIIQNYLNTTDQALTQDQLIVLAKKIRQPMWDWHIYLGYVLTGLFTIRFFLPFFGEMKLQNPFNKELILKEKFQNWIYLIFYGCVVISLSTGLLIKFGSKELKSSMEEIHLLSIYYLVAFIILHIGGVLWSEFTNQKGILSKIVSGNRKNDEK
ncbi:MAG: cytochrome B [Flavobacteria bacterium RIFCSPLOWO2_12_FULL_35_11]|nr:MAG: cytochrome B [Flavobacteria bacterium RIFCSPLOWO2_12_FULL_35_11]